MTSVKDRLIDLLAACAMFLMMEWEDIKDILKTVVVTFITCFLITTFFFRPVQVQGSSMHPQVKDGLIGFSSIVTRNISGIDRFDVVVIRLDEKKEDLIKRVIGLPGETIEFKNDVLYINGEAYEQYFLDSEYVEQEKARAHSDVFTHDFRFTLGEDEYFCMGDNRIVSADSRVYGPFSAKKIKSVGILVLFPFSEFGYINH